MNLLTMRPDNSYFGEKLENKLKNDDDNEQSSCQISNKNTSF